MSHPEFTCHVVPQYLPEESAPDQGQYAFAYTVTVVNSGDVTGQLLARHWVIRDAQGATQEVRGLAVVGHQPVLRPGERFEYTSWTRISTPTGVMQGTFYCLTEDVQAFETPVAPFPLDAGPATQTQGSDTAPSRVLH